MIDALILAVALFAPMIAFAVESARRLHPDPRDMESTRPLAQAAAQFLSGLALVSLALLALMRFGLVWPTLIGLAAALGMRAASRRGLLRPFYKFQLGLSVAGLLAIAALWLSAASLGGEPPQ